MPIPTVDNEFNLRLKAENELYRWRQRAEKWRKLLYQAPIAQHIEPLDFDQWIDNYMLWFNKAQKQLNEELADEY